MCDVAIQACTSRICKSRADACRILLAPIEDVGLNGDLCYASNPPRRSHAAEINAYDALYIPANDVPWFPYGQSGCDVQLIQADPASGRWIVKLRGPAGGHLGIHRHYGSVLALTLSGAWRYLEHEWIAHTGDRVHETPGSVHTLVLVEDIEVFFLVEGALEYLDQQRHSLAHEDWRSMTHKYADFCTRNGLPVVDLARPRTFGPDRVAA